MKLTKRRHADHYQSPAEGHCDICNRLVVLDNTWLTTCGCGADYNGSGQLLALREQWGWETREHWIDVVNADNDQ
jgi:hypothetical protein